MANDFVNSDGYLYDANGNRLEVVDGAARDQANENAARIGQLYEENAAQNAPTHSNLRGSAAYRTHLIRVLTMRAAMVLRGV